MTRYRPTNDVLFQQVHDEAVLLQLATGVYFTLNASGTRIWQGLRAGQDIDEIAAALVDEFAVTLADARSDINDLCRRLVASRLVEDASPTANDES